MSLNPWSAICVVVEKVLLPAIGIISLLWLFQFWIAHLGASSLIWLFVDFD